MVALMKIPSHKMTVILIFTEKKKNKRIPYSHTDNAYEIGDAQQNIPTNYNNFGLTKTTCKHTSCFYLSARQLPPL